MFEILFALLPMVILVISMGICKWPGDKSSLLTLVITVMLAIFAFGIPAQEIGFTLINSTARACITILSVIRAILAFSHIDEFIEVEKQRQEDIELSLKAGLNAYLVNFLRDKRSYRGSERDFQCRFQVCCKNGNCREGHPQAA